MKSPHKAHTSSEKRPPIGTRVVLQRPLLDRVSQEKTEEYQRASVSRDQHALEVDFKRKDAFRTLRTAGSATVGITEEEIGNAIDAEIAQPTLRQVMKSLGGQNAEAEATILAYTQVQYEDPTGQRQPAQWRNKLTTSLFTPHENHLTLEVAQYYYLLHVDPQLGDDQAIQVNPESEGQLYALSAQTQTLVPITSQMHSLIAKILANYNDVLTPYSYLERLVSLKRSFLAANSQSEKYYLALKIKQFETKYQWVMTESVKQKELMHRLSVLMVKTRNLERKIRALDKEQAEQPRQSSQQRASAL